MGCLKSIIRAVVIVLALIGFKAVGGWDFVKNKIPLLFEKPSQETLIEKSKDVADFSGISEEYEIDKTANVLGFKTVLAELRTKTDYTESREKNSFEQTGFQRQHTF